MTTVPLDFRSRLLAREVLGGAFLNLASSLTAEIAARAGLSWVLIDLEHGAGAEDSLMGQLQGASAGGAASLVRVASNESVHFKRALDTGAAGVMVPWVQTAAEAVQAVRFLRYPPQGVRGVSKSNRAAGYGFEFDDYFAKANRSLVTVVQIETVAAVESVEAIAAVEGVDALFVGPLDLSVSLGVPQQFHDSRFLDARRRVAEAARSAGKAAGILVFSPDEIPEVVEAGFTLVASGSDGGLVAAGMRRAAQAFEAARRPS